MKNVLKIYENLYTKLVIFLNHESKLNDVMRLIMNLVDTEMVIYYQITKQIVFKPRMIMHSIDKWWSINAV